MASKPHSYTLQSVPGRLSILWISLPFRVLLLAIFLLAERLLFSPKSGSINANQFTWIFIHHFGVGLTVAAFIILFFGRRQFTAPLADTSYFRIRYCLLHLLAVVAYFQIYRLPPTALPPMLQIAGLLASVAAVVLTAALAILPLRTLLSITRNLGWIWAYAAAAAVAVLYMNDFADVLWNWSASPIGRFFQWQALACSTFLLRLFYPVVVYIPQTLTIGTPAFNAQVAAGCSGIEGISLILVLTTGWILYERRSLRIARALWLIPISMVLIWAFNLVRIVVLIAIGTAGYPQVAVGGFHSSAGWISLNCVAAIFFLTVYRVPFFRADGTIAPTHAPDAARNIAAIYLLPFIAILLTGFLSQAASAGFDWLYPLRFFAVCAALWFYRAEYRRINWRFGWPGALAGLLVGVAWIIIEDRQHAGAGALGAALAALPAAQRLLWITFRALAAILTVPIAEELAFRGFAARRFHSPDIESVSYRSLTPFAILLSSVLFGLMHGSMWWMGILAGILFALVAKFRNRLGEAVLAHAVANALIAFWVLTRGDFSLW